VLAAAPQLRDRMVLATKGGITPPVPYDSSPAYLRAACEASLRRMGVDVIDLYQIHRPDLFAHPAEVAATLTGLRDEGKIREVGVSNHTPAKSRRWPRTSVPDRDQPARVLRAPSRPAP
jgi:aryl-alcohol dehydrogenase-like predicted oxidoreductase